MPTTASTYLQLAAVWIVIATATISIIRFTVIPTSTICIIIPIATVFIIVSLVLAVFISIVVFVLA